MNRFIKIVFAIAALVIPPICAGQGTLHITFDDPPVQPPGSAYTVQQYFESDMWFRALAGTDGFGRVWSNPAAGRPDNGTPYLQAALGDSLVFSYLNGPAFSLVSVDLAEYSTLFAEPLAVPFIGYRFDGTTINTTFTTDGIIDGTGPLADFETFYFGPEWSGLTRVEIPTFGWSLDNLVVSIPEPSAGAFFAAIMLTFIFCSMKRKLKRLIDRSAVFAALMWPLLCSAQGTLQVTFEGPPPLEPGSGIYVQQYVEAGIWFRPLGVIGPGNGFDRRRGGGGVEFIPNNGSAYIAAAFGDSFVFSLQSGSLFGVSSVDLAGYSTLVPDFAVNLVGYRYDGSTVSTTFSGSGIDFRTVYFGPGWSSGLTRVEIPNYGWSLDNLVVSIPEPGTGALLVIGTLTFLFWRMKRRK